MNFLIDTNIISEIMRKNPDPTVRDWFAGLDNFYMSVITVIVTFKESFDHRCILPGKNL